MTEPQRGGALTVQQKVAGIRKLLDKSKEQIALALPKHCTPERMLRVTMTAIQQSPDLLDCTPLSVIGGVVEAAQLGLELDGILGHAYLVPFKNKKTGKREAQLIPGYKGLVDLSRRSGNVSTVQARSVREKDAYHFHYGLDPALEHTPSHEADPGGIIAFYAVCRLRDGGSQFEWMWKRQVDAIRAQSPAKDSPAWVYHYEEMGKKTALRRLCKLLPVSVELQRLVALDEYADAGLSQGMNSVVDFKLPAAESVPSLETLAEKMTESQAPGEFSSGEPSPENTSAEQQKLEKAPTAAANAHPGVETTAAEPSAPTGLAPGSFAPAASATPLDAYEKEIDAAKSNQKLNAIATSAASDTLLADQDLAHVTTKIGIRREEIASAKKKA